MNDTGAGLRKNNILLCNGRRNPIFPCNLFSQSQQSFLPSAKQTRKLRIPKKATNRHRKNCLWKPPKSPTRS